MNIFLDFDGVICNSMEESYNSSWLAWSKKDISMMSPQGPDETDSYWKDFCSCRPFIRSGREYLAIHECLKRGAKPDEQKEFDEILEQIGSARLASFEESLYQTRKKLLQFHSGLWFSWNSLYPGVQEKLKASVQSDGVFILSTKKAEYIKALLQFFCIDWPLNRILYANSQKKLAIIEKKIGKSTCVFIDDQIDHLDFQHSFYDCRLATWGFIRPEWIKAGVSTISLQEMLDLLTYQSS